MSKLIIETHYLEELSKLDDAIATINRSKLKVIFRVLGLVVSPENFDKMADWDLIFVSVKDKQMAVQLNKLSAYMPNLKFIVDIDMPLFSLTPGPKPRRVWKER